MRYELNVREAIIHNHKVIIESEKELEELDNLLDSYVGLRSHIDDVVDEGLRDLERMEDLKIISVIRDAQGEPDEAEIDDIERMED